MADNTSEHGPEHAAAAEPEAAPKGKSPAGTLRMILNYVGTAIVVAGWAICMYYAGIWAFDIRLYAINTYGRVIHEFDPWCGNHAGDVLDCDLKRLCMSLHDTPTRFRVLASSVYGISCR